jgi:hypothetical protein
MLKAMSRVKPLSRTLVLGIALGLCVPGLASALDAPTDFNGAWLFNPERSDDLRALVDESVGPEATQGDIKKDIVRIWIRQWLLSVLDDPESAYLTVEQTEKDFKTGLADEVAIFYFGREASSRGPMGGTLKASVKWQGEQIVLEKKSEDGGRIMSVYTLMPDGKNLVVAYLLEHKTLKKPLQARMIFDRADEADLE